MFNPTTTTLLQERRTLKTANLSIQPSLGAAECQQNALPPLKSPRGHLLDRIRSTPRSAKFVPQAAPATQVNTSRSVNEVMTPAMGPVTSGRSFQTNTSEMATPPRTHHSKVGSVSSFGKQYKQDLARGDQMAVLEQQLRAQNDLLAQQQVLLQQMQLQQQVPMHYATPPYTPQSKDHLSRQYHSESINPVVYDPVTGQCYSYTPSQASMQYRQSPEFSFNVTPPQKQPYTINKPDLPPLNNVITSRSPTPPKEGQPQRQPKGPPAIELLLAKKDQSLNFGSRSRKRSTKILEAGLLRRRNSPAPSEVERTSSRASTRSMQSLGPIEEMFPSIEISQT